MYDDATQTLPHKQLKHSNFSCSCSDIVISDKHSPWRTTYNVCDVHDFLQQSGWVSVPCADWGEPHGLEHLIHQFLLKSITSIIHLLYQFLFNTIISIIHLFEQFVLNTFIISFCWTHASSFCWTQSLISIIPLYVPFFITNISILHLHLCFRLIKIVHP